MLEVFPDLVTDQKEHVQLWAGARYREGANRGNAGLEVVHAAVVDKDCGDIGELDAVCAHLDALGLAYIVHSSWSHRAPRKTPNDQPKLFGPFDCFRVILPYNRDVAPAEHTAIVQGLFGFELPPDPRKYAEEVRGVWIERANGTERAAKPRGWDPCSSRPAQGWFVPGTKPELAQFATLDVAQGRALDVDVVLARPTSPRVTSRRQRPHQAPTALSVGALGVVERALKAQDLWLGDPGYSGWRRSTCPSCKDESPSLTVRANGDGLDFFCHAQCTRKEILQSLDLPLANFAPPSDLELLLAEQLERQAPLEGALSAEEAGERLERDIDAALKAREPTVIEYPAGTGKSFRSARSMTKLVRRGERVCYATQEHAVAHETRMKLPPDVRARSVHIHSPLIQVGDEPVCARADELKERVFEFGVSLMGSVCPKCPLRVDCEALQAAKDRSKALPDASVVFVSHAGIRQVFGVDSEGKVRGADMQLIVDEMPGAFERVEVTADQLELLATGAVLSSADATIARVAQEIATSWRESREPGEVKWGLGGSVLGNAMGLAAQWGRLSLREGAHPRPEEGKLLRAADAVIRLACHVEAGGLCDGLEDAKRLGVAAMLPDACHEALVQRRGVLLSATPLMAALPGFALRRVAVDDGAKVRRVMVLRGQRGSKALTENYYDDETGRRARRDREPGEEPGIPWPWVDEALARALVEADKHGPEARILFVTFKTISDLLRADDVRTAGGRISFAHYGALRGKNEWQEGAEHEASVVYCFGTPRFAIYPTLLQLGLVGDAATDAWVSYAAGELTQAEGRLRLPRRTRPCTVVVEGDVAPSTWHADNIDELITTGAHYETSTALLEGALLWFSQEELAVELGVDRRSVTRWRQPGCPPPAEKHVEPLRKLAYPEISVAFKRLAKMPAKRRKALFDEIVVSPNDD